MKAFFIKRNKKDILLSEYQDPKSSPLWDENEDLMLHASHNLEDGEVQYADQILNQSIDFGINRYLQDTKYFFHLFVSAFIFLVVYFFFAFVVRDPLPVVDEMFLAGGATAISWILMVRADRRNPKMMKKKEELKRRAFGYSFELDPEISLIEEALEDLDRTKILELSEMAVSLRPDNRTLVCQDKMKVLLLNYLKLKQKPLYELLEKAKASRQSGVDRELVSQRLFGLAHKGSDLPLLCLILEIK